jgi:hypothetical protein
MTVPVFAAGVQQRRDRATKARAAMTAVTRPTVGSGTVATMPAADSGL